MPGVLQPAVGAEPEPRELTEDEAVALALKQCDDGEVVLVHSKECPVSKCGDKCRCTPIVYRAGAKA